MDGWKGGWMKGCVRIGWMEILMNGWMDGCRDEWMDENLDE